ncbi:Potassium transporter [Parasponia andersonii]|uniref:Potassium transporter n=1 Tax=Parasponia andersonii TaxID=3476 RepID=A0A2P5C825_PARAD|nr:Potassium transporter [Parasponia andersonii]
MAGEVEQEDHPTEEIITKEKLGSKKLSWQNNLRRFDSFDIESRTISGSRHGFNVKKWSMILHLAFQSIGIVYGDIGTSPLYVYASTFSNGVKHEDDILGAFSIIFYTITLSTLVKYIFIVLRATDNGDGGTFALYSLICRYAKVGMTPSEQAEDNNISNFQLELPSKRLKRATWVKSRLEKSNFAKYFLLLFTMLGTSMLIGDGIFTPCISVLSAVGGIKEATPAMTQDRIVWISAVILIGVFMVQRFGTDKVGYTFSPILILWFALIGGIGLYNFIKFDPIVIKALNPKYIAEYFIRNKKEAWISLCGTVLSITGAEALFADVGHFTVRSIQISTCTITYPAIILAYAGQSAFLRKHPDLVSSAFYKSIPGPLYWPMFVVAVLAAIIASQSLISGTFSIVQQSLSLGCFPRVKIVHTSTNYKGQVYIPEINYLLMVACVAVTLGFRSSVQIGNAYGLAVVFVMMITSCLLVLIMVMIWKTHILLIILYIVTIGAMELVYLSSVLYKFDQGGYLPLVFAAVLMAIMLVWNNVYRRKYNYEFDHKISPAKVNDIVNNMTLLRMPGIALFYSDLVHGIPPIFKHYVGNVPALHSVLVFVSSKSLPISKVPLEERFLFRRVEPKELNVFRCVARYGYRDSHKESEPFEKMLVEKLKEFIKTDLLLSRCDIRVPVAEIDQEELSNDRLVNGGDQIEDENVEHAKEEIKQLQDEVLEREIERVDKAWNYGVVHLIGESEVFAGPGARLGKRILIDYVYNFLERNLRQSVQGFDIPHRRMVKVGMTYEL